MSLLLSKTLHYQVTLMLINRFLTFANLFRIVHVCKAVHQIIRVWMWVNEKLLWIIYHKRFPQPVVIMLFIYPSISFLWTRNLPKNWHKVSLCLCDKLFRFSGSKVSVTLCSSHSCIDHISTSSGANIYLKTNCLQLKLRWSLLWHPSHLVNLISKELI